jgi:hypothetical protein
VSIVQNKQVDRAAAAADWVQEMRIMELERIKGKAEETCKRLETDIQNIKQQKVWHAAGWFCGASPMHNLPWQDSLGSRVL